MQLSDLKLEAKNISVVSYLGSLGFFPTKTTGTYHYYLSPLRNERRPSFLVRRRDGLWNDRGIDKHWDDVLSLVMKIEKCGLKKAVDILLNGSSEKSFKDEKQNEDVYGPSIVIEGVGNLFEFPLIYELKKRKIDVDIAKKYCQQGFAKFPNSKKPWKRHLGIVFKNNLGGYEFRNSYLKVSNTPKFYTYIPGKTEDRDFFEGFMDFLSFLTYHGIDKNKNHSYILNSLSFLPSLYEEMRKPGINNLYLDWDNAAEKHINELKGEKIPFKDCRDLYLMYEDINDMLKNHARLK